MFPAELERYGLPLDSRKGWTRLDWLAWSASLAESQEDFQALFDLAGCDESGRSGRPVHCCVLYNRACWRAVSGNKAPALVDRYVR